MIALSVHCRACDKRVTVHLSKGQSEVPCPGCASDLCPNLTDDFRDEIAAPQCPVCGAAHLYRQKDFNRRLGIALVIIGVLFAYFTYGLSLVAVTLLDWFLFRRVGEVGCCYRCETQIRGTPLIGKLEPFDLKLQDYYKNLRG